MGPKITEKNQTPVNTLLHGWGFVDGKWVYVPLWDPPPEYGALRQVIVSAALLDAAKLVTSKEHAITLKALARKHMDKAIQGFNAAWDDGDPICPPLPPIFFPHRPWPTPWPVPEPNPGPGPDPGPLYEFVTKLHSTAKNAVVGSMLVTIGQMIDDKGVVEIGNQIMTVRC